METSIPAGVEETSRPKKAKPKGRVLGEALPKEITGKDGAEMALIPAGEFQMGSNAEDDEKPVHTVYLDAFYRQIRSDKRAVRQVSQRIREDYGFS